MIIEDGILKDYSGDPIHVVIPDGVVRIGGIMTDEDQRSGKYRKEEFIFYKPFPQRSPVEVLEIPPSVKVVGDKAFEHCPNLRTVVFSEGLEHIGLSAFMGDKEITELRFPASLKTIGIWAFHCCSSLKDVYFKGKVTFKGQIIDGINTFKNDSEYPFGGLQNIKFHFENCD